MAKERPLSIPVILGIKGAGLDEAIKDTKRLSTQLGRLSDTAVKAAAGFVAFKGGQLVANFARDAIEAGRDLQVNLNGLQSVFGESTGKMVDFSKGMSSMGLTMAEAAKASTFIGSVLKQSGFAMDEVTKQTQFLIKAAADLSLTFGYDVQEALLAITALFRGEYDPIEKFGVAMKQSEIEGVKLERELDKLTGSAERFADATIRLELFTERSTDSLGAYERQANTLRVVQDQLRASFGNMEQILGAAMLPTVRDLTLSLIPLVETIGPVLAAAMQAVVPLLVSFSQNTEQIVSVLVDAIKAIAATVTVMSFLAKMLVENAELIINVAKVVLVLGGTLYSLRVGVSVMKTVRDAVAAFGVTIVKTTRTLNILKLALIGIPIIGWIAALTTIGLVAYDISQAASEAGDSLDEMFDEESILQGVEDFKTLQEEVAATAGAFDEVTEAGGAAKDAIGDFYRKLSDEIDKQRAKLRLQQMGASEGLIQSILGSGEDWQRVFNDVVSRGIAGVQDVQKLFRATAAGFDEAMQQWEEEYGEPFRQFRDDALAARDALIEFTREIEILPSIAETLGEFERSAVDNLASIEEKLKDAFDNGQLLDGSYQNLLAYARDEFQVLRQIERQRDEIIGRRNAAEALINSVQSSIIAGGRLVGILGNVQTEAEGVDVVEFATRTVSAGTSLKEFRTALLYNFVEPIEKAKSRADELVSGYRAVVERTREFVENLKALRALGLDPMLFNQLVEAGVEAGGETAKALVEGGSETVNEVNSLFKELDTLGAELGENTAQVMYGQGENFVNGIVEGLTAQAGELEISAKSIAEAFTVAFEEVLIRGINQAIDAAEAALARMPQISDYAPQFTPSTRDDGNDDNDDGGQRAPISVPSVPVPLLPRDQQSLLQRGLEGTIFSTGEPPGQTRSVYSPQRNLQTSLNRSTGSIVNIYTSSSTRETQNMATRANSKAGAPVTTSVRALESWRV